MHNANQVSKISSAFECSAHGYVKIKPCHSVLTSRIALMAWELVSTNVCKRFIPQSVRKKV